MFTKKAPNGLRLNKSIHNPNSGLIKMLLFLNNAGACPKSHILFNVFNKTHRNWRVWLFTMARVNGLVTTHRVGRNVIWHITDEGVRILNNVCSEVTA